jgi:hypothetical protein
MVGPRLHALRGAGHRLLLLGKRRTGMFVHDGLQEAGRCARDLVFLGVGLLA